MQGSNEEQLQATREQNERLKAELEAARAEARRNPGTARRIRRVLVGFLVVLGCLSLLSAAVAIWVHEAALDTETFVGLVGPVAENPEFQLAMANYTTDQLFEGLQVQDRLAERLPGRLSVLAAPVTRAARDFTQERVEAYVQTESFQDLWVRSLTVAHTGAVRVIRDEAPNVSVVDGEVQLNLMPFYARIVERLGQEAADLFNIDRDIRLPEIEVLQDPQAARDALENRLGLTLPEGFGTLTLMSENELAEIQAGVRFFDRLVYVLVILTVVVLVAAIALSVARRRTLVEIGIGVAIALLVARVATRILEARILESVSDPLNRGALRAALGPMLGNLRTTALLIILVGAGVAIAAYLAGKPHWFRAAGAWLRDASESRPGGSKAEVWVSEHYDWLRVGGTAILLLIFFITGIGWFSVLVLGGLLALYLWALSVVRARADDVSHDEVSTGSGPPPALPPAAPPSA